jgi:hypothetical protein
MSVLTAKALAQEFTPAAPSPAAGQSPFGSCRATNGASSSPITVEPGGNEYRASSASEVGSVLNCAPQWLHPPAPGRRRRRISSKSRHRTTDRCLSNSTNELLMLPKFLRSGTGPLWRRNPVVSHCVLAQNRPRAKRNQASGSGAQKPFFSPKMPESSPGVSGCRRNAAAFWRVAMPTVVLACSWVDKSESV